MIKTPDSGQQIFGLQRTFARTL